MKSRLLAFLLFVILPATAFGQGAAIPGVTFTQGPGNLVRVIPRAAIVVCNYPATGGVPCTNYATTYNSPTLLTTCPVGAQVIGPTTTACVGASDGAGNFTIFVTPSGSYTYYFRLGNNWQGPYVVTATNGAGVNLGAPGPIGFVTPSTIQATNITASSGAFTTLAGLFPVNGTTSNFVLGDTITNPCCSLPEGSLWMLDGSLHGAAHVTGYDGSSYFTLLVNNDSACDFSAGCTGNGAQVALQNSPHFTTPDVDNATGISMLLASTTGDNMDLQQGLVTPFVQATPTAGHIKTGYGSDGTFKLSNGSATDNAFYSFTQTVAKGTAAMTTGLIAGGACGTTVTVGETGVLTSDTIEVSRSAAVTNSNGGQLTLNWWPTANNVNLNYCNPGAGNVTPGAATVNFKVTR